MILPVAFHVYTGRFYHLYIEITSCTLMVQYKDTRRCKPHVTSRDMESRVNKQVCHTESTTMKIEGQCFSI